MRRNKRQIDCDEIMRLANPLTEPASRERTEAAFERVLSQLQPADQAAVPRRRTGPARRVRFAMAAGAVAITTGATFVVINLLPATHVPAGISNAWAQHVIARAAAAVSGSGDGILHIDQTVTIDHTGGSNPGTQTFQTETWEQQTAPHSCWETGQSGSQTETTTVIDGLLEHYDSSTNTVAELKLPTRAAPWSCPRFDPAYRAALQLMRAANPAPTHAAANPPAQSPLQTPDSFSDLITQLLKTPGVSVDSSASVNGAGAIRITSGNDTLYVQPDTYKPLEFVIAQGNVAGGDGETPFTITTTFNTYETLPAGSVSPPDLLALHPDATSSIQLPH